MTNSKISEDCVKNIQTELEDHLSLHTLKKYLIVLDMKDSHLIDILKIFQSQEL